MSILAWIVLGLIAGFIASKIYVGTGQGILMDIVLGIVGAVVGGWMGRMMGMYGPNQPAGFIMALIGAIVVLAIYRMAVGRKRMV